MASMTPVARYQSCAFLIRGIHPQVAQSRRRDIDRRWHIGISSYSHRSNRGWPFAWIGFRSKNPNTTANPYSYLALAGQATQFTLYSCEQRVHNHSCFSGSIHGSYCRIDHIGTERSDPMALLSDIGGCLSWIELCTGSCLASSGRPISGFLRRPSCRTLRV